MGLFDKMVNPAFIKEIKSGERIDWYYRVTECEKKKKKDGGEFLVLTVMDKTGKISAKMWDGVAAVFPSIIKGKAHKISGEVVEYKGTREIKVLDLRPALETDPEFDPENYLEKATFDTTVTFDTMMTFIRDQLTSPHLLKLADLFAIQYGPVFKEHYGAQKIHHAYPGGLLEHSYNMVRLAAHLAEFYSLDKELLCLGALLHDMGKTAEFTVLPAIETTMDGGLLGHIVIGVRMFGELERQIPGFPSELSTKILHLLVSHHGEKEFGSPEVPKTAESMVLNYLDLIDSRLAIMSDLQKNSDPARLFSEYNTFLGGRILVNAPLDATR